MYLTFDVGASAVKVALSGEDGRLVRKSIRDDTLATPAAGWCAADPETYWRAVVEGTRGIRRDGRPCVAG